MQSEIKWGAVVGYALIIFWISSLDLGEAIPPESKFRGLLAFTTDLHIPEYMVLGALLYWASQDAPGSILSSALYGVTDELHQWFVPFRFMDPYDIMVDWFGSLVGVIMMIVVMRYLSPLVQHLAGVGIHLMRYGMSPEGRQTK